MLLELALRYAISRVAQVPFIAQVSLLACSPLITRTRIVYEESAGVDSGLNADRFDQE